MKTQLTWNDLFTIMSRDNGGRWYAKHPVAVEYCASYRSPSRAWPHSHSKALLTVKFAKWAKENHPEFAQEMGLISETVAA